MLYVNSLNLHLCGIFPGSPRFCCLYIVMFQDLCSFVLCGRLWIRITQDVWLKEDRVVWLVSLSYCTLCALCIRTCFFSQTVWKWKWLPYSTRFFSERKKCLYQLWWIQYGHPTISVADLVVYASSCYSAKFCILSGNYSLLFLCYQSHIYNHEFSWAEWYP